MKKLFCLLFCVLSFVLVLSMTGCGIHVNYSFDTKEFNIAQGQSFVLTYEENLSNADAWECHFRGEAGFEVVKDTRSYNIISLFKKGYAKRKLLIKADKSGEGVVYLVRKLKSDQEDPYETRQINVTVTPKKSLGTTGD